MPATYMILNKAINIPSMNLSIKLVAQITLAKKQVKTKLVPFAYQCSRRHLYPVPLYIKKKKVIAVVVINAAIVSNSGCGSKTE